MSEEMVLDEGTQVVDASTMTALARGEFESQMDAAHKYPRQISRVLREAASLAMLNEDVARSCIYGVPRDGKIISGPSVRLAEIMASSYGNMHVASRVVQDTGTEVVARGIAWDIEKNVKIEIETRRRITGKSGRRYSDDMVITTGNAACSIALRNAIFRVIPRALVDQVYAKARGVSVGDAKTLATRRADMVDRLQKIGVPFERIFPRVGAAKIEDIGLDQLEQLVGLGTAIKDGHTTIDEAFPPPEQSTEKAAALETKLKGKKAKGEPDATPAAAPVAHDGDGVVAETDAERAAKVERGEA